MNGRGIAAAYRLTICSVFFSHFFSNDQQSAPSAVADTIKHVLERMCDLISSAASTVCIYEHITLSIFFTTMLSSSRTFAYHYVNTVQDIIEKMSGNTKQSLPFLHEFPHIPAWQTMQWYKKDNNKNESLMSMILQQQNQWIFLCLFGWRLCAWPSSSLVWTAGSHTCSVLDFSVTWLAADTDCSDQLNLVQKEERGWGWDLWLESFFMHTYSFQSYIFSTVWFIPRWQSRKTNPCITISSRLWKSQLHESVLRLWW